MSNSTTVAPEGSAEEVGLQLVDWSDSVRGGQGPNCLIFGGETTVSLVASADRGLGGAI